MAETLLATGAASAFIVSFAASLWVLYVLHPNLHDARGWAIRTAALMALAGMTVFGVVWLVLFSFYK